MNSDNAGSSANIRALIQQIPESNRHLLHVLHAIQQEYRHISHAAVIECAYALGLPVSQVESVVGFYAFLHHTPRGRFDILFSNCSSCGDLPLMQLLCERLGVEHGITRADGMVSVDTTSCIGMCDQGPAALVNGMPVIRLSEARIAKMAELIESGSSVSEWPGEWFEVHDHLRQAGLLLGGSFEAGEGLKAALAKGADALLEEIGNSGLRGRGGAGFSTGRKWRFCREAKGAAHYVICNADEGEPGTFKDRVLLASYADMVFEGMSIAGFVIGARQGYLYLRGEYRYLLPELEATLARRRKQGLLGEHVLGHKAFSFDIDIVVGAGAYICGEESALIESLEEKRGVPRVRPPFPVTCGYRDCPTVVNNVETLAAAAKIAVHGSDWFAAHGTGKSAGSKILSISGDCVLPGIYEFDFGVSMRQILDECGGDDIAAIQVGGPSGSLIGKGELERRLGFEDLATGGSLMMFGEGRDLLEVVHGFICFFAHESCGFCTPCRVGTTLLKKGLDKIERGHGTQYDVDELGRLAVLVKRRSHCGLGQTAPNPVIDLLNRFPEIVERRLVNKSFEPHFDLDTALDEARGLTHRDDAEAHL